jgi:TRAP-type C4-dicarboxylate transport system permease small subunit
MTAGEMLKLVAVALRFGQFPPPASKRDSHIGQNALDLKGKDKKGRTMPKLVRLYISSVAIGFALSAIFVAMLVWLDVSGLRHLILDSNSGWIAAAMMVMFNGVVFAGVQFAIAVMRLAQDDDTPRGGRKIRMELIPVRVPAPARPGMPRRR